MHHIALTHTTIVNLFAGHAISVQHTVPQFIMLQLFCLSLQPLSVELGPGLLTTIFDGIQRPLKAIALSSGDCFIPRGVDVPALDRKKQWEFNPGKVKVTCCCAPSHASRETVNAMHCLNSKPRKPSRIQVLHWLRASQVVRSES